MKHKKTILAVVLAICILAVGFFIWKDVSSRSGASEDEKEASDVTIIENEGEVVIILPDGQESGGF